jgi:diguanylate cyclase (GGDEF)-like protein
MAVDEAPAGVEEVHILWISEGMSCDGDTVSITAAGQPGIEDVLLGAIPGIPKVNLHNKVLSPTLGGEEFLLAWSGISIKAALRQGNALCERLRKTSFADIVGNLPVTASLGLACSLRPVDPSVLLRAADQCLYEAKHAGRDQVIGIRVTGAA